jgi:hypothetical protein
MGLICHMYRSLLTSDHFHLQSSICHVYRPFYVVHMGLISVCIGLFWQVAIRRYRAPLVTYIRHILSCMWVSCGSHLSCIQVSFDNWQFPGIELLFGCILDGGNYGVATISRFLEIIGHFCRISSFYTALLQKRCIILRSLLIVAILQS